MNTADLHALHDRVQAFATAFEADPTLSGWPSLLHALDQECPGLPGLPSALGTDALRAIGRCSRVLGNLWFAVRRFEQARDRLRVALGVLQAVAAQGMPWWQQELAGVQCDLARALVRTGGLDEAQSLAERALAVRRLLTTDDPVRDEADLAQALHVLGFVLGNRGLAREAVQATGEALQLRDALVARGNVALLPELARSVGNLALWRSDLGQGEEALALTERAVAIHRALDSQGMPAAVVELARELNNLATMCSDLGRQRQALELARESATVRRRLFARDPEAFRAELAYSLHNVGTMLHELHRSGEALAPIREAVALRRQLAARNPAAHRLMLGASLLNEGVVLRGLGDDADAVQSLTEAVAVLRDVAAEDGLTLIVPLGMALHNLSLAQGRQGHAEAAGRAAAEAVTVYRSQLAQAPAGLRLPLATALVQLGVTQADRRQADDARHCFRQAGALLMDSGLIDPFVWCEQVETVARRLTHDTDLHDYHLRMIRLLGERREFARDVEHARRCSALQRTVADLAWRLLPWDGVADQAAVRDDAALTIVRALHSPDLSRWIGDGNSVGSQAAAPTVDTSPDLRAALREVLDADRAYVEMLRRHESGEDVGTELDRLQRSGDRSRSVYHALRGELLGAPEGASPQALTSAATLRACLARSVAAEGHRSQDAAVLVCLLLLGDDRQPRAVGWVLSTDADVARCVELPGLPAMAARMASAAAEAAGWIGQGARWRCLQQPTAALPDANVAAPEDLDSLALELHRLLWQPLLGALAPVGDGSPKAGVATVHLCLHGALQQLPLALLDEAVDRSGLRLVLWPTLPAFVFAATRLQAASPRPGRWLVGQDGAWEGQPLPMAPVEATLASQLIGDGHIEAATPQALERRSVQGLLVCGHGRSGALLGARVGLGQGELAMARLIDERLAPSLALLPVCHAGFTAEDGAGNAYGVAVGFMLGGARLVVASSRAVDDDVIPWFTVLMLWHMAVGQAQPLPALRAAQTARRQIASGCVPRRFVQWLNDALPVAFSVLQPGGRDWPAIQAAFARGAIVGAQHGGLTAQAWIASVIEGCSLRRLSRLLLSQPTGDSVALPAGHSQARRWQALAAFIVVYGVD